MVSFRMIARIVWGGIYRSWRVTVYVPEGINTNERVLQLHLKTTDG